MAWRLLARLLTVSILVAAETEVTVEADVPDDGREERAQQAKDFLEANGKRPGVVQTKSGMQYRVLEKGTGLLSPTKEGEAKLYYMGTTLRLTPHAWSMNENLWTTFANSEESNKERYAGQPELKAGQFIAGFRQALMNMTEGDFWEVYIPPELGYGDRGWKDKVLTSELLIFRIKLKKLVGKSKERVRTRFCDVYTKEYCEKEEKATVNTWGGKSLDDVAAEIQKMEASERSPITEEEKGNATMVKGVLKRIQSSKRTELEEKFFEEWKGRPQDEMHREIKAIDTKMQSAQMKKGEYEPARARRNALKRILKDSKKASKGKQEL